MADFNNSHNEQNMAIHEEHSFGEISRLQL
jgi:hypothetical protein